MPSRAGTRDRRSIGIVLALLAAGLGGAQLASASPTSPSSPLASRQQGQTATTSPPAQTTTTPSTPGSGAPSPPPTGSITLTDKAFVCRSPVQLSSVTVTIDASSKTRLAVQLGRGCTGSIGKLTVHQSLGDGVDVAGASHLTIGGGTISCTGRSPGFHQDGIQAMSGDHVTFSNMTINCATSSNSGFYVNAITTDNVPSSILFVHGTIYRAGSSTAFVNQAIASGVEDSTLYPSRYFTYRKSASAIDIGNRIP